jgi:hypothetical protein
MSRAQLGVTPLVCLAGLLLAATSANAGTNRYVALGRRLARTIERDAHAGGPPSTTTVRRTHGCCHHLTLTVRYARTGAGGYTLTLVTLRAQVRLVEIAEVDESYTYDFTLQPRSRTLTVRSSGHSCPLVPPPAKECLAFGNETSIVGKAGESTPLFTKAASQASAVLAQARAQASPNVASPG